MYRLALLAVAISACGVCIFSCGFFLQRRIIERRSNCTDALYRSTGGPLPEAPCWYPARFNKTVILLVDALKHEFALYGPPWDESERYRNKMPVFSELVAAGGPSNALLVKFIADAPTTTLQRLKGLMTGSLPTFIDIGANFYQTHVREDNLIEQLAHRGKRTVFMGDDTWTTLFPNKFSRTYAYPSFVVRDLHTVDNGVLEHLYPELRRPDTWDVMVAHFLGVDHCGHWLGKNHPEMAAKLTQMDNVVRNVTSLLQDDTLLVVMSDHGMTTDGDHGGETQDELEAVLFLYAKQPFLYADSSAHANRVVQVDFVPTLALLLGLPIPYSSLGRLMPHIFPVSPRPRDMLPLWLNVQQVARYLGDVPNFPLDPTVSLSKLRQLWDACLDGQPDSADRFSEASLAFLAHARRVSREVWATYDLPLMWGGLALALGGALIMVRLGCGSLDLRAVCANGSFPVAVCAVCWLAMPFSNSFVVAEDTVTLHLLQVLLVSSIVLQWSNFSAGSKSFSWRQATVLLVALRTLAVFWRCREEHHGSPCEESALQRLPSEDDAYGWERVSAACLCAFMVAQKAMPVHADSLPAVLRRFCLMGAFCSLAGHWLVQLKPAEEVCKILGAHHQELLPNVAVVLLVFLLALSLAFPSTTLSGHRLAPVAVLLLLFTLAGESYVPALTLLAGSALGCARLWDVLKPSDLWGPALSWLLLGQLGFFATGHQTTFSTVHWKAAFVGARGDGPPMALGGLKVLVNTFAGPLLCAASVPLLAGSPKAWKGMMHAATCYTALLLLQVCSTMGSCLLLRRHLMVWAVFAPRLLFQAVSATLCLPAILVGWAVYRRAVRTRTSLVQRD
ncbi:unnamed protein product [Ixodes hexagonus]